MEFIYLSIRNVVFFFIKRKREIECGFHLKVRFIDRNETILA